MRKLSKTALAVFLALALAACAAVSITTVAMADPGECNGISYNPQTKEFQGTFSKNGKTTVKKLMLDNPLLKGLSISEDGKTLYMDNYSFQTQYLDQNSKTIDGKVCPFIISDDITIKLIGDSFLSIKLSKPIDEIDPTDLTGVGLICEGNLTFETDSDGTLNIDVPCPVTKKVFDTCIGIQAKSFISTSGKVVINLDGFDPCSETQDVIPIDVEKISVLSSGSLVLDGAVLPSGYNEPIDLGELLSAGYLTINDKYGAFTQLLDKIEARIWGDSEEFNFDINLTQEYKDQLDQFFGPAEVGGGDTATPTSGDDEQHSIKDSIKDAIENFKDKVEEGWAIYGQHVSGQSK